LESLYLVVREGRLYRMADPVYRAAAARLA